MIEGILFQIIFELPFLVVGPVTQAAHPIKVDYWSYAQIKQYHYEWRTDRNVKEIQYWRPNEIHDSTVYELDASLRVDKQTKYYVVPTVVSPPIEYDYSYSNQNVSASRHPGSGHTFRVTYDVNGRMDSIISRNDDSVFSFFKLGYQDGFLSQAVKHVRSNGVFRAAYEHRITSYLPDSIVEIRTSDTATSHSGGVFKGVHVFKEGRHVESKYYSNMQLAGTYTLTYSDPSSTRKTFERRKLPSSMNLVDILGRKGKPPLSGLSIDAAW